MLALEEALAIVSKHEEWGVNDDLCDCTYQRAGYWYNPYIGEVYEVRLCCVWAEFEKQFPQFFRRTQIEPAEWNGEADMPRSIWHRQLARLSGLSLSVIRTSVEGIDPPKGTPRPRRRSLLSRIFGRR